MTAATITRKPATRTRKPAAKLTIAPTASQISKAKTRARTARLTRFIVTVYLLAAVAMSFTHIATLFGLLGSDWQRWIAPVMIDTVAVIGKLSMSPAFTPATQKRGKAALIVAGSVSFVANITAGYLEHMYGNAIIGAVVVLGALWAESHLSKMTKSNAK